MWGDFCLFVFMFGCVRVCRCKRQSFLDQTPYIFGKLTVFSVEVRIMGGWSFLILTDILFGFLNVISLYIKLGKFFNVILSFPDTYKKLYIRDELGTH